MNLDLTIQEADEIYAEAEQHCPPATSVDHIEIICPEPSKLKAVQQNRVYVVDAETWRGGNLLAAHAIIDDLYKYLLNTP